MEQRRSFREPLDLEMLSGGRGAALAFLHDVVDLEDLFILLEEQGPRALPRRGRVDLAGRVPRWRGSGKGLRCAWSRRKRTPRQNCKIL